MAKYLDFNGLQHYNSVVSPPLIDLVNYIGNKNLLPCTMRSNSGSMSGVDWTVDSNGVLHAEGITTNEITITYFYTTTNPIILTEECVISGHRTGDGATYFGLQYKYDGTTQYAAIYNAGTVLNAGTEIYAVYINRAANQSVNITISPMLCTTKNWKISSDYVPYRNSCLSNAEIDAIWTT